MSTEGVMNAANDPDAADDPTTGDGGEQPSSPAGGPEVSRESAIAEASIEASTPAASDTAPLESQEPKSPEPESTEAAPPDPATHRFECRSCGFVYDPDEGVRKLGIPPGTPFLELDAGSFRCPVCRSRVGAFKDIGPRSKPSGFEENLNFGIGVNRLTPGQKNVLIFGGLALGFAFFLSLYSLR
jgi:rubredoxin